MDRYCFSPDPVVPVTEPAASRLVPPTYPPAPPGTAGAGDSEDPRAVATSLLELLQMVHTPACSIREMLGSLETIPLDGPLAPTIRDAISTMQQLAAGLLDGIYNKIQPRSQRLLSTDLDIVKRELLRMAAHGVDRATLDRFAQLLTVGDLQVSLDLGRIEGQSANRLPDQSYFYPLPRYLSASQLGLMHRADVVRAIIADLHRQFLDPDVVISQHTFDLHVTQRLLALHYVVWFATSNVIRPTVGSRLSTGYETPGLDQDPEERRIRGWRRFSSNEA